MANNGISNIDGNDIDGKLSAMIDGINALTAVSKGQTQQLGAIRRDVSDVKMDLSDVKDRVKVLEEDEALRPYQVKQVERALHIKVTNLLGLKWKSHGKGKNGIEDESRHDYLCYYGRFKGCIHNDAKSASIEPQVAGWKYTPRKNFERLIEFINDWYPAQGVDGLKREMDKNDAMRREKSAGRA